jgi:hypothetical protein
MSDSLIDKYAKRSPAAGESRPDDADGAEDLGSFGWLRGVRDRAIMLELRKKGGHVMAIGYAWLERADFDPSDGITLHVGGRCVRINGTRLNADARPSIRLFDGIVRHRVPWIREGDRSELLAAGDDKVVVESIVWDD